MLFKLLPLLMSFSLSMRSPNIAPNPMDYEMAYSMQKADTAYVELEFERENGINYFDKETWLIKRIGHFSIKERYLEKQSRELKFNSLDFRYNHKGWSAGYALKHIEKELYPTHNLIVGWKSKSISKDFLVVAFSANSFIDISTDFQSNIPAISTQNEAKFRLNAWENISISFLIKYERLKDDYDYQIKTSVNLELK